MEAYTRILLRWRRQGERWIYGGGENGIGINFLLLEALQLIEDPQLRSEIEEALKKP